MVKKEGSIFADGIKLRILRGQISAPGEIWIVQVALNAVTSFLTGERQRSDPHSEGGRRADGADGFEDASLQDQGYSDTATSQGVLAATRVGGGGEQILPRASEGHSATDTLPSTTSLGVHSTSRDGGQLPPFPTPISLPQHHLSENLLALGCNVPPQSASLPPHPT